MNDPAVFGRWFSGRSWNAWRAILKAAFALPMTRTELEVFGRLAGGRQPPRKRVKELWIVAGRRSGKDSIASLLAAWTGAYGNYAGVLRPGEKALVMCLAVDREQAGIVLGYTRAYFEEVPLLKSLVTRETKNGLTLSTGAEISIITNNHRATRGRACPLIIGDEIAYWRGEEASSASPDTEVFRATKPSLLTIPGSMWIGISSPYMTAGLLYEKHKAHFAQDDDAILVVQAASEELNPSLDPALIAEEREADPESAVAEFDGKFRRDLSSAYDRKAVEAAVLSGVFEIPYSAERFHYGFVDTAGGSGRDSYTAAIARTAPDGRAELCALREWRPDFSPAAVAEEAAALFRAYGISEIRGDNFGGGFPREPYRQLGITYYSEPRAKSELYRGLLSYLNSGKVALLDNPRLVNQFCALERRAQRGGKDTYDHPRHGHDDCANSATGALLQALEQPQAATGWPDFAGVADMVAYHDPHTSSGSRTGSDLSTFNPLLSGNFEPPQGW